MKHVGHFLGVEGGRCRSPKSRVVDFLAPRLSIKWAVAHLSQPIFLHSTSTFSHPPPTTTISFVTLNKHVSGQPLGLYRFLALLQYCRGRPSPLFPVPHCSCRLKCLQCLWLPHTSVPVVPNIDQSNIMMAKWSASKRLVVASRPRNRHQPRKGVLIVGTLRRRSVRKLKSLLFWKVRVSLTTQRGHDLNPMNTVT